MPAITRIGDPISCGDNMAEGSGNVFSNGIPVSRIGVDLTAGHCFSPVPVVSGSPNVFVNNIAVDRVTDPIEPHCCGPVCHDDGKVSVGSPNVFVNEGGENPPPALEGKAAVYEALDSYVQPGIAREVAGLQHDDDPDSDQIYVSYRKAALEDAGIVTPTEEVIEESAPPPPAAPGTVPTDCADIMAHVGSFPGSFQLSTNFTLAQVTTNTVVSNYKIRAQCGLTEKEIVCNLRALCVNVLEPMKAVYGSAMKINSGFRHGDGKSQHYKGEGCDIAFTDTPDTTSSFNRAKEIKDTVAFDQYIYEQNNSIWHHVSYKASGTLRRVVLTKPRGNKYLPGLLKVAI